MQEDTERLEVKDFAFSNLRRFRFFHSSESGDVSTFDGLASYRLLTVSNAYGLIFVAWPGHGLTVIPTSELHKYVDNTSRDRDSEVTDFKHAFVDLAGGATGPIVRLHCNCDGSALAVCYDKPTPLAHIYDVRALAPEFPGPKPIAPLCRVRLDDADGSSIIDFQWNPTSPEIFASCGSSGTATVISINFDKINMFTVQGAIKRTAEAAATCLSWSPKGKQLAVGFDNGSICQYKPQNLHMTKMWSPPSQAVAVVLTRLVDICWLSTNQFALVTTGGRPDSDHLTLVHLSLPKETTGGAGGLARMVYTNYDDVCFGTAGERRWAHARYIMQHVQEWAMLLCSSTASMETAVLGWKTETKRWHVWDLEDVARCQLPLTRRSDETYPVGIDIDRTCEMPLILKAPDGEVYKTLPPAPILLILSTDGALCPYRMIYKTSEAVLCQPPKKIDNWSDVKVGVPLAPAAPASASTIPKSSTTDQAATVMPNFSAATTPGSLSGSGDISAAFTLPLPQQRKQPIPVGAASGKSAFTTKTTPTAAAVDLIQPKTEVTRESEVERAEKEKSRLLRMDMIKWAVDFEKQLVSLKSTLTRPLPLLEKKNELVEKTRTLSDMQIQVAELKDVVETDKSTAEHLRATVCGHLVRADQTNLLAERRRSQEFRTLLRYRPLSSAQEQEFKTLKRRQREASQAVENLTTRVEKMQLEKKPWQRAWNDSPAMSKGERRNSLDLIYQTLANMQSIVMQQRQRVETIKKEGLKARQKRGKRYGLDDTDQLADSLMDTQLTDDSADSLFDGLTKRQSDLAMNRTPYRINDSLRRLLEKRDSTPRRTTVPVLKPPTFTYMKKSTAESSVSKPSPVQAQFRKQTAFASVTPTSVASSSSSLPFATSTPIASTTKPATSIAKSIKPQFGQSVAPLASTPAITKKPVADVAVNKPMAAAPASSSVIPKSTVAVAATVTPKFSVTTTPSVVEAGIAGSGGISAAFTLPVPQQRKQPIIPDGAASGQSAFTTKTASTSIDSPVAAAAVIQKADVPRDSEEQRAEKEKSQFLGMDAIKLVPSATTAPPTPTTQLVTGVVSKSDSNTSDTAPAITTSVITAPPVTAQKSNVPVEATPAALILLTTPEPAPSAPVTQTAQAVAETAPSTTASQPTTGTVTEVEMNAGGDMDAEAVAPNATPVPTAPSFSFLTPPATAPATTGGIFAGGGGFFSGLGGQPSPEAAKRNVFATSGFGLGSPMTRTPSEQAKSLFGGGTPKTETLTSPGFGSFGGGGSPSVAQQGFGGFGSSPTGSTGFGSSSVFGGKPAFGAGTGVFGGSPTFGSAPTAGGSIFGGSPAFGQTTPAASCAGFGSFGGGGGGSGSGFAAFAQKPMPTFGALASNTAQTPAAPAASPFGGASGGFGGSSPFSGFGSMSPFQQQAQQQPSSFFGGQQQSTQQQQKFSQWR